MEVGGCLLHPVIGVQRLDRGILGFFSLTPIFSKQQLPSASTRFLHFQRVGNVYGTGVSQKRDRLGGARLFIPAIRCDATGKNSSTHGLASSSSAAAAASCRKTVAIVWFKHDLRVDDHPGLAAAAEYEQVLPLFIFDPQICTGWSKEQLEGLFDAVADLKLSLQTRGSDLVIVTGSTKDILFTLAQKVGATSIIMEEEEESKWQKLVASVMSSLSALDLDLQQWRASLYDTEKVEEIPDSYKEFQRLRLPILHPLDPPISLPVLPKDIDPGVLPNYSEFSDSVHGVWGGNPWWEILQVAQEQSAESLLPQKKTSQTNKVESTGNGPLKELMDWREKYILESHYASSDKRTQGGEFMEEEIHAKYVIRGGATGASDILNGYLRFLEPTGRDDWKAVYEHIWNMEKKPGASFRALFGSTLALGTLSRRRVLYEALKYEKERNGGRLSPFGFSTFTVAAAVGDVKSIEYTMMGDKGPAVVLVHGFGAFWEHYRDNIRGLAEKGYRVWALTMVGFGRSEKPNITYTELLWAEQLRDFIVEVVGEPVILAGNSIGGYMTTVVAGLWPSLVTGLVLLNTAGRVIPDYKALTYNKPKEKSVIAKPFSQLLMLYLQTFSDRLLTRCYPNNASRVDDWLLNEVKRASYDPGSTRVLESCLLLRPPLPLNYFLDRFAGRVLVIQGKHDPLQKNSNRAPMLQANCTNVSIAYLDAGHCPHDEIPDEVNKLIHDFVWSSEIASSDDSVVITNREDTLPADAVDIIKEGVRLINEDILSSPLSKKK
ncbi:hypothetical protein CY35_19G072100 [Sphagnum magellanicum]|nr:hypothetical protein CY35_19G072100 [Sphagnum magellanicum]